MSGCIFVAAHCCAQAQTVELNTRPTPVPSYSPALSPLADPSLGSWGFDTTAEDRTVKPGDDFNAYANGSWIRHTTIPPDRASVGLFANLRVLGDARTQAILQNAAASKASLQTPEGKLGAMYKSFMDVQTIDLKARTPLEPDINHVHALANRQDMAEWMGHEFSGFQAALFELDTAYDHVDPTRNSVYLDQGGLGLPDRDYYLDMQFAEKKKAYQAYAAQLLQLADWPDAQARAAAIVSFETRIAEASWTHAEERDTDKTNNPMTIAELEKAAPAFPWRSFLKGAGLGNLNKLVVLSNTSVPKIAAIYASTPLNTLKAWEAFRTVDNAAPYMAGPFIKAHFDFRSRTLSGQPEMTQRSKLAGNAVNDAMGSAIGEIM